jgi:hypothetical protein
MAANAATLREFAVGASREEEEESVDDEESSSTAAAADAGLSAWFET